MGVLRLAFEEIGSQHFDLDFLAIVVDSANMRRHHDKLRRFGMCGEGLGTTAGADGAV